MIWLGWGRVNLTLTFIPPAGPTRFFLFFPLPHIRAEPGPTRSFFPPTAGLSPSLNIPPPCSQSLPGTRTDKPLHHTKNCHQSQWSSRVVQSPKWTTSRAETVTSGRYISRQRGERSGPKIGEQSRNQEISREIESKSEKWVFAGTKEEASRPRRCSQTNQQPPRISLNQ